MREILLGCGASAALHKACDLASKLTQAGHRVRAVLTPSAARLIRPQLFEALTGEPAWVDEFADGPGGRRGAMDHIELAGWARLAVVAPASADLCSRLALGLADDLLTTACLALPAGVPRLLCPAMNSHMLDAPPIRRNLEVLTGDGWTVLMPGAGHLACGVEGQGRLAEVGEMLAAIERLAAE